MIQDNIKKIKEDISLTCQKIGGKPEDITIVAVTKQATLEDIKQILGLGMLDIGENRLQEAILKYNALRPPQIFGGRPPKEGGGRDTQYLPAGRQGAIRPRWHMVGHLQTNKVKEAVKIFDLIHSVDSIRVAEEIDKQASGINKSQDILVQVNASLEASKFGIKPEEAIEIIKEIAKLKNLNINGLMTVAPIVDDPEKTRPYFRMLRELKDRINQLTNNQLTILSMGMTDDYQVAIEEGANMIRLGRAIFGN